MRKEDRVRQERNREQQPNAQSSPQPKQRQEKMRGSAEGEQPSKPPRQSGKLPLPD